MTIREIHDRLVKARRPIDFFEDVGVDELKRQYKKYAKIVHPDIAKENEKYLAGQAFMLLNQLYVDGLKEYESGIYTIVDIVELYEKSTPLFEIDLDGVDYKFYEYYCEGEVANLFKGTNGEYIVFLKVAIDPTDNELINKEFELLNSLKHQSLPIVEKQVMINDSSSFIMREVVGISVVELLKEYPRGVPAEHVMWMLERLFSIIGYLHSNFIVHGNIKPEHIVINKSNHNVSLLGFSLCISEANAPTARYQIVNDGYTALEISKTEKVLPNSDIYSIGKIAILLLGGDIRSNGMPIHIDVRIRNFIRKLVNPNSSERCNDAWKLWDEVIDLRTNVFGTERFKNLE